MTDEDLPRLPFDATRAVVVLAVIAVVARLVLAGLRVAHFDEGRVAWWTLEYMRTGEFSYQYIIHGPFIQHVNTVSYALFGQTDFAGRVPIAIIGGLLPLSALFFREHLRDEEVVTLAVFLALNPILLYYGRFLRSTVLVAAFSFVAFGFLVRTYDTREVRYVYGAVAFLALAFAAKENAVVYVLCWLGAGFLVVDHSLFAPRSGETGIERLSRAWERHRPDRAALIRYGGHAVLAMVLFLAITVFFFAPRSASGVGLYDAVRNPALFGQVWNATVADISEGLGYWFGHTSSPGCNKDNLADAYVCFLGQFLSNLVHYAAPLFGLAIVGFVLERYASVTPRSLVMFASYWGFVSVIGYPLGTDIYGSWITVNALVPLAIPAAVGFGLIVRYGLEAYRNQDSVSVGLAALLVVLLVGQMAFVGVQTSYIDPASESNGLVQYAQPEQNWRPVVDEMGRLAATNEGPDVLVYGEYFVDNQGSATRTPACIDWFNSLPLAWYLTSQDAEVVCANSTAQLEERAATDPPVIIARDDHRGELVERFPDYAVHDLYLRTVGVETVVLVRE
jgi:uncharacterized protein (TIGR03663 family)